MGFNLSDSTSQLIASSNDSSGVSFGPTLPTSGLTVGDRQVFAGGQVTPGSVPPNALNRITGSVTLSSQVITTVNLSQQVEGFGVLAGAVILSFTPHSFDCVYPLLNEGVQKTFDYSVF